MKVHELIAELRKLDADALVVLSKDSEGNAYGPLDAAFTSCSYRAASARRGDLVAHDEEIRAGDVACVACVVLWPR